MLQLHGMRLGVSLGYWGFGVDASNVEVAVLADELGYDSVWVAEAYGSDAVTVLSWVGARTSRIGLGSAVMQIPARTPAMTAMTAATLDTLSGGRCRLGLGVSGPQVSEGWHGVGFAQPLARTREYVDVVRMALSRKVVAYEGRHVRLPLPGSAGKALRMTIAPMQERLPIYLAAVGPKNLELAGEIADGLLAIFYSPEHSTGLLEHVRAGRARAGQLDADGAGDLAGFDVNATVQVVIAQDPREAAAQVAPNAALYIGGMGSREVNFYNRLACEMGFEREAAQIQDLYLAGRPRDAAAAVPFEFLDATALLGTPPRIVERARRYADAGVSTLTLAPGGRDAQQRGALLREIAAVIRQDGARV